MIRFRRTLTTRLLHAFLTWTLKNLVLWQPKVCWTNVLIHWLLLLDQTIKTSKTSKRSWMQLKLVLVWTRTARTPLTQGMITLPALLLWQVLTTCWTLAWKQKLTVPLHVKTQSSTFCTGTKVLMTSTHRWLSWLWMLVLMWSIWIKQIWTWTFWLRIQSERRTLTWITFGHKKLTLTICKLITSLLVISSHNKSVGLTPWLGEQLLQQISKERWTLTV